MYYSTGIELIFSDIFKTTANLKRNMGFCRTTANKRNTQIFFKRKMGFCRNYTFLGLPKEHFGQVSKIPKIAPKLTKTHVL